MKWLKKLLGVFDVNNDNKVTAEDLELAKALAEKKIKDANAQINDQITDAVTQVASAAKETKRRVKRVKEELADVGSAVKEVADQAGDVVAATKGKTRSGRKSKTKK